MAAVQSGCRNNISLLHPALPAAQALSSPLPAQLLLSQCMAGTRSSHPAAPPAPSTRGILPGLFLILPHNQALILCILAQDIFSLSSTLSVCLSHPC